MDTTTRAPECSPSITIPAHGLALRAVAQSPADLHPEVARGRHIILVAGIVMGHVVTLFGPLLLGRWLVAPL